MQQSRQEVLIADDDRQLIDMLRIRCLDIGLAVQVSSDALQALVKAHQRLPALVILDISMPSGNGLGVCEMMAADNRLRHIPVIILTGDSKSKTQERVKALGAHYVMKSSDIWVRLEPVICDLLSIDPAAVRYRKRIEDGRREKRKNQAG